MLFAKLSNGSLIGGPFKINLTINALSKASQPAPEIVLDFPADINVRIKIFRARSKIDCG